MGQTDRANAGSQPLGENEILVIGRSPLLGSGIDADKVPNVTRSIGASGLSERGEPSLIGALNDKVGSVGLDEVNGNACQPDFEFRGFTASPLEGTPQGVAVYQNGIRVNEAFGDTVNWDLIPAFAIDRAEVTSTDPVFGFNALGGAVALSLKTGEAFSGVQADAAGGMFGHKAAILQAGGAHGDLNGYMGFSAVNDNGWRHDSPTQTRNAYGDIGYGSTKNNVHLSVTGADNTMVGAGPTPVSMLDHDRAALMTTPQTMNNQLTMVGLRGTTALTQTLSLQGNVFFRDFLQHFADGNPSEVAPCAAPLDPSTFCIGGSDGGDNGGGQTQVLDQNGHTVPVTAGGTTPGEVDESYTSTKTVGVAAQLTSVAPIADHGNHVVFGADADQGRSHFRTDANLGPTDDDRVVHPTGILMQGGSIVPIGLNATSTHGGVFLTDTFDATSALSVTLSARLNEAHIVMDDLNGGDLSGDHRYDRLNPSAGFAYKFMPALTWYANYAENNRAPTAAELSCADPQQSCSLSSFYVADPDLKQVVAKTFETGLRGTLKSQHDSRFQWNFDVFRTDNTDDIIEVSDQVAGKGFFENAGTTRRQGAEAALSFESRTFHAGIDYSYVDATYRTALTLQSPDNPYADAGGDIQVKPGDHLPGIPRQRVKVDVAYAILTPWTVGAIVNAASSQYLRGDESNQTPQLGGYTLLGLHTEYRVTQDFKLWASVDNVLNRRYETFGTFTDTTGVPISDDLGGSLGKTRTVTPGEPLTAYAGVRVAI